MLEKLRKHLDAIHPTRAAEPEEQTFDDFLTQLDLADRKGDLADYLEEGQEMRDLKQMDEDDLNSDILDDDDLGLTDDVKEKFREAVAALRTGAAAEKGGGPAGGDDTAVEMHEACATLKRELSGEDDTEYAEMKALREKNGAREVRRHNVPCKT